VLAYGGVPGEPEMTAEELAAVAEVARRTGRRLAAHAHGARSIREAIRSATSVAARYLGWEDRGGALAPGRFGDLVAVRGDPTTDVTVLEEVASVVKGGLVFVLPER
jgi:imidazolonepropionase-like amidohydrolase